MDAPTGTTLAAWLLRRKLITQTVADDPDTVDYFDEVAAETLAEFEDATGRSPFIVEAAEARRPVVPKIEGPFLFIASGIASVTTVEMGASGPMDPSTWEIDIPYPTGTYAALRGLYDWQPYLTYFVTGRLGYAPEIDAGLFAALAGMAATKALDGSKLIVPDAADLGQLKRVTEGPVTLEYAVPTAGDGANSAGERRDQWASKYADAVAKYRFLGAF